MRTDNKPSMEASGMICRRLIRGIVLFNAVFYVIYWLSPSVGVSINDTLRNLRLNNASYYWLILSTVALPILLITEVVKRASERKMVTSPTEIHLFDAGVWIDSVLVAGWILATLWAFAHGAAAV
jgi:hypothetical protein